MQAVKPRIFIADDSRVIRERLTELVSVVPGTTVVGLATSVLAAEQRIAETRPDLVILDLQMPGGAVMDLIGRLKHDLPALRIAVMSMHASEYRQRLLAAGADFVLHKAREIHQIEDITRIVSNERRAWAELESEQDGSASTELTARGGARLILNVDDYKPALYARTRILRRAGFEVLEAASGRNALKIADEQRPHLVLLDVHLPDMSGLEVCRRIKSSPACPHVAVIHISATYRSERDRADGLRLSGADAYLTEPITADQLLSIIERVLGQAAAGGTVRLDRPIKE